MCRPVISPAEWSRWNVSLTLAVAPAWPAEPVSVAQPATRRMQVKSNRQKECVQMPGKMARSDPRPSVRVTRGVGSGQHLASVLQEGRENANIGAGLGFIWRISAEAFERWLKRLRDQRGRAAILARFDRLIEGNPGDVRWIGEGVTEMRIDVGPGYRVYYTQLGDSYVMLLAGDKGSQRRDIAKAKALASELDEEE